MTDAKEAGTDVRVICRECGSAEVTREAWATWDVAGQRWVLGAVFDYAFCQKCMGTTKLDEVPC